MSEEFMKSIKDSMKQGTVEWKQAEEEVRRIASTNIKKSALMLGLLDAVVQKHAQSNAIAMHTVEHTVIECVEKECGDSEPELFLYKIARRAVMAGEMSHLTLDWFAASDDRSPTAQAELRRMILEGYMKEVEALLDRLMEDLPSRYEQALTRYIENKQKDKEKK